MCAHANVDGPVPSPKIALIAFHDARLNSLILKSSGDGKLEFSHMCVYIETSPNEYDVWSYQVDLMLDGVKRVSIGGPLNSGHYVSDGHITDVDGCEIEMATALTWTVADNIELVLSSADILSIKVARVQVMLVAPLEKLETWSGPLG
jgi:hypothetical protein